ncbi:hypothetical protein DPMN_066569 [Dreissena polymorpha]|uniref:Uncharacterized protein n=1 Tax=Dreissena polymorpha TaxID=45954 RepID=A0A9D3YYP3_DREPO|nr:hypothetical protein DPMN_066569 [Dreissena polymorpha]
MFRVHVRVNGLVVQAVVDSAAEVTLVSDRVVAQLPVEVPVLEHVYMNKNCNWVTWVFKRWSM